MPIAEKAYLSITTEIALCLDVVVRQHTRQEIADAVGIPLSTVRNQLAAIEDVLGCKDQRELARWWQDNKRPWLAWLLRQLDVDPRTLVEPAR